MQSWLFSPYQNCINNIDIRTFSCILTVTAQNRLLKYFTVTQVFYRTFINTN